MRLTIKYDDNAVKRVRDINKQVRFAASVAVYETARACAEGVKEDLDKHFTVRKPWIKKGIWVAPSGSKAIRARAGKDGALYAEVGTADEFMALQALGGTKRKKGRAMGVPVEVRNPITTVLPPSKWPKALLQGNGDTTKRAKKKRRLPFLQTLKNGKAAILVRTSTKGRYPLKILYVMEDKVDIRKRWPFREEMERMAPDIFEERFSKAFDMALRTAK